MTVVRSAGQLLTVEATSRTMGFYGDMGLYGDYNADYAAIYRTQPNVRTVVSFLARNIAQLGLKVYRRISDNEREHLADHSLAALLRRPNQFSTAYRWKESLVSDMAIYANAFWIKAPATDAPLALLRVPPQYVEVIGDTWWAPDSYRLFGREHLRFRPSEVVHFRSHNPSDSRWGLSPLESLRRVLAEEAASGEYREYFWKNRARVEGVLKHPGVFKNNDVAMRLREQFEALYSGARNSGKTAILEEGMEFESLTSTAKDAQYLETRKLTREEVAAAYHIPPPMVGILDHATFSNITQQHRMTYQDTLAPWLTMIEEEIELQLLSEFPPVTTEYVEFNLAEKLNGSFEEQAQAAQASVGAPWMTRNEIRARYNLPPVDGGDELVTPLNVLIGGQASPLDSAPKSGAKGLKAERGAIRRRARHIEKHQEVLGKFFTRLQNEVLSELGAKARTGRKADVEDIFPRERWDRELSLDMLALGMATATDFGKALSDNLESDFDPDLMLGYLEENSRIAAENVNLRTSEQIAEALEDEDPKAAVRNVLDILVTSRLAEIAGSRVSATGNFGRLEAAKQSGRGTKTWTVTSAKSRHPEMNGETVTIEDNFSNGLRWPGDASGSSDETANCHCLLDFS